MYIDWLGILLCNFFYNNQFMLLVELIGDHRVKIKIKTKNHSNNDSHYISNYNNGIDCSAPLMKGNKHILYFTKEVKFWWSLCSSAHPLLAPFKNMWKCSPIHVSHVEPQSYYMCHFWPDFSRTAAKSLR